MINKTIVFFDTETTGLKTEDKICEFAFSYKEKINSNYGSFSMPIRRRSYSKLVNPNISITPEASVTTGIKNSDVINEDNILDTKEFKIFKDLSKKKNSIFVAYNAPFDTDMFYKDSLILPEEQIIDLYRVVKHLYNGETIKNRNNEDEPLANNKLQYFRYLLNFDDQIDFKNLVKDYGLNEIQAHTALSDVIVLEYFFYYIKETFKLSNDDLLSLSNKLVLERNVSFGNVFEKGSDFNSCFTETYTQFGKEKIGYDYFDWCSKNLTFSVDTLFSLKTYFFRNIINGNIPYKSNFLGYINFGLVFDDIDFEDDNIISFFEDYSNILGERSLNEYKTFLTNAMIKKLDKELEDKVNEELSERFPSYFLYKTLTSK